MNKLNIVCVVGELRSHLEKLLGRVKDEVRGAKRGGKIDETVLMDCST